MIIFNNKEIPFLYLFIYKLMREKAGDNIWLDYPSVKEILKRNFHNLPNVYYYITLKDMEELGLIRKVGNNPRIRYELIAKDIDKLLHDYNHTF